MFNDIFSSTVMGHRPEKHDGKIIGTTDKIILLLANIFKTPTPFFIQSHLFCK